MEFTANIFVTRRRFIAEIKQNRCENGKDLSAIWDAKCGEFPPSLNRLAVFHQSVEAI